MSGPAAEQSTKFEPDAPVSDGRLTWGRFHTPFATVNLDELRVSRPRAWKWFRLKEWQALQFGNEQVFGNVALFDAKALAIVQCKVFDRRTGKLHLFERKLPSFAMDIAQGVRGTESRYAGRGCDMAFKNDWTRGTMEVTMDLAKTKDFPGVRGTLRAATAGVTPLVVCLPFDDHFGMYSQKALMPLTGRIDLGGESLSFEAGKAFGLMDDHKGYYPFAMAWDWSTAAGYDAAGRLVGFNLTRNQARDPERFNENCLWIDGRCHALPTVTFTKEGQGAEERWTLRDAGSRVRLSFTPLAESRVDIQAVVLRSRYRGPIGEFSGELVDEDGVNHKITRFIGMSEDFYLRV